MKLITLIAIMKSNDDRKPLWKMLLVLSETLHSPLAINSPLQFSIPLPSENLLGYLNFPVSMVDETGFFLSFLTFFS